MFNEVLNFHYAQNTALFMMLYYTDTVWSVKVSLEGYYLPDKDISLDICDHWSRKLSLQDPISVTWASQSGLNVRLCSTGLVHNEAAWVMQLCSDRTPGHGAALHQTQGTWAA